MQDPILLKLTGGLVDVRYLDSVVFRYLWQTVPGFLEANWPQVEEDIGALRAESDAERASGRVDFVRIPRDEGDEAARDGAVEAVRRKLQDSRRTPAVERLASRMLVDAFQRGALRPEVYGDARAAFHKWRGRTIAVYDELSADVQEAWLTHATAGNLRDSVARFYQVDENQSREPATYARIATELGGSVLIATERAFEALAASHAGLRAVVLERQGVFGVALHGLRVETNLMALQ
jgi:methionine salvage enolase-phosphatase E1